MRVFDRGDVVSVSLDPAMGHEQKGTRPALVLTPQGVPPIPTLGPQATARPAPIATSLPFGTPTTAQGQTPMSSACRQDGPPAMGHGQRRPVAWDTWSARCIQAESGAVLPIPSATIMSLCRFYRSADRHGEITGTTLRPCLR